MTLEHLIMGFSIALALVVVFIALVPLIFGFDRRRNAREE